MELSEKHDCLTLPLIVENKVPTIQKIVKAKNLEGSLSEKNSFRVVLEYQEQDYSRCIEFDSTFNVVKTAKDILDPSRDRQKETDPIFSLMGFHNSCIDLGPCFGDKVNIKQVIGLFESSSLLGYAKHIAESLNCPTPNNPNKINK